MKTKFTMLASLGVLIGFSSFAQKIKVTSGDLDFLKGQTAIHVEYDYDNMGVGKFDKEEDYINEKVEDYNKKEAGRGDKWRESWVADREERFQPKFEELLNKNLEKSNVKVGEFPDAAYTMLVKTTYTEPGFNVGVVRKNAYTDYEVVFIENETQEELATMTIVKSPGLGAMGYDFDSGLRIQESYAKAGKELGQYLAKSAFK